jgi:rod shape-determining protein MreD
MIFSYIFTALFAVISLIIQSHPSFDVLRVAGVKPDLLFIVIVYVSYSFGSFYGEVTAFISGLLHDSLSNTPLGLLTFPKISIALIIGMFGRTVIKSNIVTITLLVFAASLAKGVITLFFSFIFNQASASAFLSVILPEAFYNAILSPALFFIFDKVFEKELEREGLI